METVSAFFRFKQTGNSLFTIKLTQPEKIDHARRILSGDEKSRVHVQGIIVKEKAEYNPDWSYHLEPKTIDFFEIAIEVCDANMEYIEENLDEVGGPTLPNNHWCPWSSKLVDEINWP